MKVTIDRAKWLRGEQSVLADGNGCMCVLGFVGAACGIPVKEMVGIAEPEDVEGYTSKWPAAIGSAAMYEDGETGKDVEGFEQERLVHDAISNNDDEDFESDRERELTLQLLFKESGIDLEFIGEGRP